MTTFSGSTSDPADLARLTEWLRDRIGFTLWRAEHFEPERFEVRGYTVVCGSEAHAVLSARILTTEIRSARVAP